MSAQRIWARTPLNGPFCCDMTRRSTIRMEPAFDMVFEHATAYQKVQAVSYVEAVAVSHIVLAEALILLRQA